MSIQILFQNTEFIFVNKPYDMYINSDDENVKNTVACAVGSANSHRRNSQRPLHFVQRLDYATSGALCLARNRAAAARAGRVLEARLARKYYLAVIRGHYNGKCCDIQYAIDHAHALLSTNVENFYLLKRTDSWKTPPTKDALRNHTLRAIYQEAHIWGEDKSTLETSHKMLAVMRAADTGCIHSRAAETRLLLLEKGYYEEDPVSVVLLKPITGRRHQLRVHCQAIGHSVLGDCTYGDDRDRAPHRMFLHARRISLPMEGSPLDVETPEPFFSDPLFYDKWHTHTLLHSYRSDQDFRSCCDLVDNIDSVETKKYEICGA